MNRNLGLALATIVISSASVSAALRLRPHTIVALLVMLPMAAFTVVSCDNSGWGAPAQDRVLATESGGYIHSFPDEKLSSGGSLYYHILLEVPGDHTKWLNKGTEIRVISHYAREGFAKVGVFSGPHQGCTGWVGLKLITPRWYGIAARVLVLLLLASFGLLLLSLGMIIGKGSQSKYRDPLGDEESRTVEV